MVRKTDLQSEVRSAVRDYVDQLITERHAPGRGMAVSAHDLMVAARSAGQTAKRTEADQLLEAFAASGIQIIQETPRAVAQPRYNPHKTTVKTDTQRTRKKDYHWMAWPSPSSTPQPNLQQATRPQSARSHVSSAKPPRQVPLSARPASKRELAASMIPRPESATTETKPRDVTVQKRPQSACIRAPTPRTPSARAPTPRIPTPAPPVQIRAPTPSIPATPMSYDADAGVAQLYVTPQPTIAQLQYEITNGRPVSALSYRSATPQANRCATPRDFDPNYRDIMEQSQVTHGEALRAPSASNPTYVPALKAWITNANDYEREVAYNLLQAIGSGAVKKHSPYKAGKTVHTRHPTAGVQTTYSIWDQFKNASWDNNELVVAGQSLSQPPGADYYRYKKGARPGVARHMTKFIPPKEYTCEASFFMNSNRPFKRDFVINPEWASESNKMKRNLSMMMTSKGPQGLRYSSK